MSILKDKSTRLIITAMVVLAAIALVTAKIYYGSRNKSVDPRVVKARELYSLYNGYAGENNFPLLFPLLDSIEQVYNRFPHYSSSFEKGVLYNNRGAALLIIYLHGDSIPLEKNPYFNLPEDSVRSLAEMNIRESIRIYEEWKSIYGNMQPEAFSPLFEKTFLEGLEEYSEEMKEKFLKSRKKEIRTALYEINRRLSVSYTNLGVIYRTGEQYPEAVRSYQKALELWDRNLEAENNLNKLLGRPLKKRNILQKMFPPERTNT